MPNTAPSPVPRNPVPYPQALNNPDAAMMPPGEDWTALDARIDEMTPACDTNVTVGLSWGFQLPSPNDTFRSTKWSC